VTADLSFEKISVISAQDNQIRLPARHHINPCLTNNDIIKQ
jgi:hypothetical protein